MLLLLLMLLSFLLVLLLTSTYTTKALRVSSTIVAYTPACENFRPPTLS